MSPAGQDLLGGQADEAVEVKSKMFPPKAAIAAVDVSGETGAACGERRSPGDKVTNGGQSGMDRCSFVTQTPLGFSYQCRGRSWRWLGQ